MSSVWVCWCLFWKMPMSGRCDGSSSSGSWCVHSPSHSLGSLIMIGELWDQKVVVVCLLVGRKRDKGGQQGDGGQQDELCKNYSCKWGSSPSEAEPKYLRTDTPQSPVWYCSILTGFGSPLQNLQSSLLMILSSAHVLEEDLTSFSANFCSHC